MKGLAKKIKEIKVIFYIKYGQAIMCVVYISVVYERFINIFRPLQIISTIIYTNLKLSNRPKRPFD